VSSTGIIVHITLDVDGMPSNTAVLVFEEDLARAASHVTFSRTSADLGEADWQVSC
jgi:hypothetical protein